MRLIKEIFLGFILLVCAGVVLSIIHIYVSTGEFSGCLERGATILSIILGLVSIAYTYISGKKTLRSLDEITQENKDFINKIRAEMVKDNYDEVNLTSIKNDIEKRRNQI